MRNAFPAPSITAECTGQFSAMCPCKDRSRQIPDWLKRLSHNGRCSKQDSVCKTEFFQHFCLICLYHIIAAHIYISAGLYSFCDLLSKLGSISISTYIRNDHCFLRIWIHDSTPLFISIQHPRNLVIDHRSMSGTDHTQIQLPHSCQCFRHKRLKRSDNIVKIIFCGTHIIFPLCHLA